MSDDNLRFVHFTFNIINAGKRSLDFLFTVFLEMGKQFPRITEAQKRKCNILPGILVEGAGSIDKIACMSVGFVIGICCKGRTDSLDLEKIVRFKNPDRTPEKCFSFLYHNQERQARNFR